MSVDINMSSVNWDNPELEFKKWLYKNRKSPEVEQVKSMDRDSLERLALFYGYMFTKLAGEHVWSFDRMVVLHNKDFLFRKKKSKDGAGRFEKLSAESYRRYQKGNFKSKRDAGKKLLPEVNKYAKEQSIAPLCGESASDTIAKWLGEIEKGTRDVNGKRKSPKKKKKSA